MEDKFKKLFEVTSDTKISLSEDLKQLLNKELCLGMTRWVCRHGTLGDGFEKLTSAQKYYQSLKETYTRAVELRRTRAKVKEAYADFLEASKSKLAAEESGDEILKIRSEAKLELAEITAGDLLVHAEDTLRQLDEFNKIRLELQDSVRAEYPNGIEQAEPDNWRAVLEYRAAKAMSGAGPQDLAAVPLPIENKMQIIRDMDRGQFIAQNKGEAKQLS
jgi:hypothetical protein